MNKIFTNCIAKEMCKVLIQGLVLGRRSFSRIGQKRSGRTSYAENGGDQVCFLPTSFPLPQSEHLIYLNMVGKEDGTLLPR